MPLVQIISSISLTIILLLSNVQTTYAQSIFCEDDRSLNTAIGCIRVDNITQMTAFFLRWSLGLAGGIATVLILYAGIKFVLSQGDPKQIQAAKELFISSISGLLMIVFSVFLLRVIGVDILNIL